MDQNNKYLKKFATRNDSVIGIGNIKTLSSLEKKDDLLLSKTTSEHRKSQLKASQNICRSIVDKSDRILRDEQGKPRLEKSLKHISISHSAADISLIVGTVPVAIDIEEQNRQVSGVKSKFTTDKELSLTAAAYAHNPAILIWSCKECLFKTLGLSAVHFIENLQLMEISNSGMIHSTWNVSHPEFQGQYSIDSFIFEHLIV